MLPHILVQLNIIVAPTPSSFRKNRKVTSTRLSSEHDCNFK